MAYDWESLRSWGQAEWERDSSQDWSTTGPYTDQAGYEDYGWDDASGAYQTATGKNWSTGEDMSAEDQAAWGYNAPAPAAANNGGGGAPGPQNGGNPNASIKDWNYWTKEMDMAKNMANYTSRDSPMSVSARSGALRNASRQGLLNSSMAVGNAQNAVYQAAQPLAQNEAQLAYGAATARMGDATNRYNIAQNAANIRAQIASAERISLTKSYTSLVGQQLGIMGSIYGNEDIDWTTDMQSSIESVTNASKGWIASVMNIELT